MKLHLLLAGLALAASNANAHTPYFVPQSFEPVFGGQVTLDASFAEKFFVPEVAFNNGDFQVIDPSGNSTSPNTEIELKTRVVIEHELSEPGTYKFSTGTRYGSVFRTYELDGEKRSLRGMEEPLPEGAELLIHFQSVTRAESYISKEAPTPTVLTPTNQGLEIIPITHPNESFAEEAFKFQILFNGQPLNDLELSIYLGQDQFSEESGKTVVTTDTEGKAEFTPATRAVYLINARHRADAPEGAEAPIYSHTTTLSIEAF